MAKRKAEENLAKKEKDKQPKVLNALSKESITKSTNEIINSIEDINVDKLIQIIGLYDPLLTKFETEEGLAKYESTARLLNLQLFKIFEKLFDSKLFSPSADVHQFKKLKQSFELFKFNLLFFMENIEFDCSLIIDNLDIYMKLFKFENIHFAPVNSKTGEPDAYFPTKTYKDLITTLLKSFNGDVLNDGTHSNIIIQEFITNYYKKYYDLQFYFVTELPIEELKEAVDDEVLFAKFLTVLKEKSSLNDIDAKNYLINLPSLVTNTNHYKTHFESKWLYFLNKSLAASQYKTTLLILHKRIVPYFKKPTNLMDFLTDSYEVGGIISILSLNGLFELMKNYNLDYPNFYQKLYSLVDTELLQTKYKSRFLRLTDLFLTSTHLPAALVASFIKKLARLSITASPSSIVSVIPFVYNLLKRHPTCMILLQNSDEESNFKDPFNNLEKDPLKTNAIDSSLWELETLQTHYHPNVATLAKIYSQPFRKQSYNMEDFLDWSYTSLLDSEFSRKLKDDVALEYESFESLIGDYVKNWEW